ncbi:MAG: rhamnulokinase, partial [Clostridia bacterium]|nr:rhamnulokinase [Clostridia bacterium]
MKDFSIHSAPSGAVYLAVDIGASSGRHIVSYLSEGKLVLREVYRFHNGVLEIDKRRYWDVDRLFREILNGLAAAKAAGYAPDYVGIDTWAVDYVLLDGKDCPIGTPYAYRDDRGAAIKDASHARMDFPSLYEKT